jgi:hypothetical protein
MTIAVIACIYSHTDKFIANLLAAVSQKKKLGLNQDTLSFNRVE